MDLDTDVKLFLKFAKKVQREKASDFGKRIFPKNVYLVKSPRKDDPHRKMWRVKRQCGGSVFIKHYAEAEKAKAYQTADEVNAMTKPEFIEFVKLN